MDCTVLFLVSLREIYCLCQHEPHQWGEELPWCDSIYHLHPQEVIEYHMQLQNNFGSRKLLLRRGLTLVRPSTIFDAWEQTRKAAMCWKKSWKKAVVLLETHTGLNPLCDSIWQHFVHRMKRNLLKRQPLAHHPARLMWVTLSIKSRKPAPNAIMHIYWA